jgi:hypothetical protein
LTLESKVPGSKILKDEKLKFGYGVMTAKGFDGIIVTTTHAGLLDSELQKTHLTPYFTTIM